jgi:hypothetical protein
VQNLLVAVAVLVAVLYSGWSLMPSRLQLRLLQRADAAAATRLPAFRERVLAPLLRRRLAAGGGCSACSAGGGAAPAAGGQP